MSVSISSPAQQGLASVPTTGPSNAVTGDWTRALPVLRGQRLALRELVTTDAPSLMSHLAAEEVSKFISTPPATPEGFEQFIATVHRERKAGRQFVFGILPDGCDHAVGLVQMRAIAPRFAVAEWGFAIGSTFWGTGLFLDSARMALDFAFEHTPVHRLEARAVVQNSRGNGVLRKLGAIQEGVLEGGLRKGGKSFDQVVWSITPQNWLHAKTVWSSVLH